VADRIILLLMVMPLIVVASNTVSMPFLLSLIKIYRFVSISIPKMIEKSTVQIKFRQPAKNQQRIPPRLREGFGP
jgi:hypothetical protein